MLIFQVAFADKKFSIVVNLSLPRGALGSPDGENKRGTRPEPVFFTKTGLV